MDIYAWTMLGSIAVYILVANYAGRRVKAVERIGIIIGLSEQQTEYQNRSDGF